MYPQSPVWHYYSMLSYSNVCILPCPQAICEVIGRDDDVRKIRTSIEAGVEKAAAQLQEYTKNWDKYVDISQPLGCTIVALLT